MLSTESSKINDSLNSESTENEVKKDTKSKSGRSHHSHHSHHSNHSHHSHRSHHSHGSSSKRSSSRQSGKSRKSSASTTDYSVAYMNMNEKITKTGLIKKIKDLANSLNADTKDVYLRISRRILFCIIIFMICVYSAYVILVEDVDKNLTLAGYTPSETSQLKIQVTQLQNQLDAALEELHLYKEKYGELD